MNLLPTDSCDETSASESPCLGGLIAGTLALMTTWASPEAPAHRGLIARKIVFNLSYLRQHPGLGEPMRRVIAKLHERWLALAPAAPAGSADTERGRAAALH